ncbi:hypothetical protein OROHE_002619 [Orobanche hederae]
MECAGKGSLTPCYGPPIRRCNRCRAVVYCSLSHQVSHRSVHKIECERLKLQMKRADVLNNFPFTFTQEANQETRCSFLIEHGIHGLGMWMYECGCGVSDISFDDKSHLCPCKEPLTVYWAIQVATRESLLPEISNELRIHYLGPEKELLQLAVFGELQALFPGVQVHIDLVGPAIPHLRNGERIDLSTYAQCNEMDCHCKSSVENAKETITPSHSRTITLKLHADSFPHIIVAPNAGIAAYTSWLPTLEVIKQIKVPAVFSDYCEEASCLAASCITSVTGPALNIQIQINPFRQPFRVEESALCIPCYSNCLLFGS